MENDFAFIDYLWRYWTSEGYEDVAHLRKVKTMLSEPGVIAATLGYYRAMLDSKKWDLHLYNVRQAMDRPISVSTLALCGREHNAFGSKAPDSQSFLVSRHV